MRFEGRWYFAKAGPCSRTEKTGCWLVHWLRLKKKGFRTNNVRSEDLLLEDDAWYAGTEAAYWSEGEWSPLASLAPCFQVRTVLPEAASGNACFAFFGAGVSPPGGSSLP